MRITSRTFTGQSYAFRQLPSTSSVLWWHAGEAGCKTNEPDSHEGGKTDDCVPHLVWIGAVVGMQIGLHCVVKHKKKKNESRAAKPCEPRTEELQSGF